MGAVVKNGITRKANWLALPALWSAMVLIAGLAHAQEAPLALGRYTGTYLPKTPHGAAGRVAVELVIATVAGGKVEGSVERHAAVCGGTYNVAGSYRDSQLALRGGPAGDCAVSLRLVVDGDRLTGSV